MPTSHGEHGVVRGELVEDRGDVLRVDRLAAGLPDGELVELVAGIAVVRLRLVEELVGSSSRRAAAAAPRACARRRRPAPRSSARAAAEVLGAQVDLGDLGAASGRIAGTGKSVPSISSRSQSMHRVVAGREPEQPGHADIERIVVLDVFLAAQGVHDRRLQPRRRARSISSCAPAHPAPQRSVTRSVPLSSCRQAVDLGRRAVTRSERGPPSSRAARLLSASRNATSPGSTTTATPPPLDRRADGDLEHAGHLRGLRDRARSSGCIPGRGCSGWVSWK